MSDNVNLPFDHGAIARQVIDNVDVDKLLSNLQGYRDFAAKNRRCEMANDLQNAIMVIAAMRYELKKEGIRMSDNVSHPNHYNHGGLECFDALRAALGDKYIGFLIGNVIKYCWRYEHKNGIEDLQKARAYIDEAIKEFAYKEEVSE